MKKSEGEWEGRAFVSGIDPKRAGEYLKKSIYHIHYPSELVGK